MLAHRIDGEGAPVVLLNGGLMSIASWDGIVRILGGGFRIIRCDFRGQLLSAGPFPSTLEEHARDVIELLDHIGVDRAHVAGTSFGAEAAMVVAAIAPQRLRSLTVATAVDRSTPAMRDDAHGLRVLARAAASGGDGGELFLRMVPTTFSRAWLQKQPADFVASRARQIAALPRDFFAGAAAILGIVEAFDMRPYFAAIAAPTLVMAAANDELFPLPHSRAIAAAIPGARLEIIADSGHAAVVEQPARFAELMRDFWSTSNIQH